MGNNGETDGLYPLSSGRHEARQGGKGRPFPDTTRPHPCVDTCHIIIAKKTPKTAIGMEKQRRNRPHALIFCGLGVRNGERVTWGGKRASSHEGRGVSQTSWGDDAHVVTVGQLGRTRASDPLLGAGVVVVQLREESQGPP